MVSPARFPSLVSIRAFEAAARLGSFAKAALELGTTAASVSYHVRQLEDQVGVRLFLRHPHRVELTEPGALIARETTTAFASLRASFARAADLDEARLSVTTLPTLGASWLTPRLGRFQERCPGVRVELDLSATAHDLAASPFDAAIRNGRGGWAGLRAVRLFPSLFMPLCAPNLKAAAGGLADPDCPVAAPLLGRPDWWALWRRSIGVDQPLPPGRFGAGLPAEHLDIAAAIAGHGIAIGSPILFRDEIESGRLVPAHDAVAGDGRSFWLTWPIGRRRSRKIELFQAWLEEEAARDLAAMAPLLARAVTVPASA